MIRNAFTLKHRIFRTNGDELEHEAAGAALTDSPMFVNYTPHSISCESSNSAICIKVSPANRNYAQNAFSKNKITRITRKRIKFGWSDRVIPIKSNLVILLETKIPLQRQLKWGSPEMSVSMRELRWTSVFKKQSINGVILRLSFAGKNWHFKYLRWWNKNTNNSRICKPVCTFPKGQ